MYGARIEWACFQQIQFSCHSEDCELRLLRINFEHFQMEKNYNLLLCISRVRSLTHICKEHKCVWLASISRWNDSMYESM